MCFSQRLLLLVSDDSSLALGEEATLMVDRAGAATNVAFSGDAGQVLVAPWRVRAGRNSTAL